MTYVRPTYFGAEKVGFENLLIKAALTFEGSSNIIVTRCLCFEGSPNITYHPDYRLCYTIAGNAPLASTKHSLFLTHTHTCTHTTYIPTYLHTFTHTFSFTYRYPYIYAPLYLNLCPLIYTHPLVQIAMLTLSLTKQTVCPYLLVSHISSGPRFDPERVTWIRDSSSSYVLNHFTELWCGQFSLQAAHTIQLVYFLLCVSSQFNIPLWRWVMLSWTGLWVMLSWKYFGVGLCLMPT